MNKIDIITKTYFGPAGFGSLKTTLEDAKKHDSTITAKDVKDWKDKMCNEPNSYEVIIVLSLVNHMRSFKWICVSLTI